MYNGGMISDKNPPSQTQPTPRQILEQARSLARNGQYHAAKSLLETIPEHPIAQKWLVQLSGTILDAELAFDFADTPILPTEPAPEKYQYHFWTHFRTLYAAFSHNRIVAVVFGGIMIVLGMMMIVNFVALSWIDSRDAALWTPGFEGVNRTALQVWFGTEGGSFATLDLEKDAAGLSGFGAVRMVDRSLILIPLASIYMILLSLRFMVIPDRSRRGLYVLLGLSIFLLLMPYIWETLSTRQWQAYLETVPSERLFGPYGEGLRVTFGSQALSQLAGEFLALLLYDTYEQKWLGAMVVVVCLVMVGGRLAERDIETESDEIDDE